MDDDGNNRIEAHVPMSLYTEHERALRAALLHKFDGGSVQLRARFEDLFKDVSTICETHQLAGALAAVVTGGSHPDMPDLVHALVLHKHSWAPNKVDVLRQFCHALKISVYVVDPRLPRFERGYFDRLDAEDLANGEEGIADLMLMDYTCPHCKSPLMLKCKVHKQSPETFGIFFGCSRYGQRNCGFICGVDELWQYIDVEVMDTTYYVRDRAIAMLKKLEEEKANSD